jgi:3-keto-disaccharide hydrolase
MEILNSFLKKLNLSGLEIFSFIALGLGFLKALHAPALLPYLNSYSQNRDLNTFPYNVFFVFLWLLFFLVGKRLAQGILKFLSSFLKYSFRSDSWPKEWEYQGNIRLGDEENFLLVTDSNSGCILKNHYWKNFEMEFKCKFPTGTDDQTLGIIFRAQSLSDYLMIQINNKVKKIVPHIRTEGKWETMRLSTYDIKTTFRENVVFDVILRVLNEKVELFINGNQQLDWNIPTNSDLNSSNPDKRHSDTIVPRIEFRNSYGKIGFRAYQGESAMIKDLSVKRIPGFI